MKCEFCGGEIPFETTQCPNCGAPCKYIEKNIVPEAENINEKKVKKTNNSSDFVPMGSSDISFLQRPRPARSVQKDSGSSDISFLQRPRQNQEKSDEWGGGYPFLILGLTIILITFFLLFVRAL